MKLEPKKEEKGIAEKDWLDLSWKYFQQHAQQRISYFNFFVIFSTILTTGIVSTYQKTFGLTHLGVPLGLLQVFVAFMFYKLDERNKILTKHAETTIKRIESTDSIAVQRGIQLFLTEEQASEKRKQSDEKIKWYRRWFEKVLSHSTSYRRIYVVFMIWGLVGTTLPFFVTQSKKDTNHIEASVLIRYAKVDSLQSQIVKRDSIIDLLFKNIGALSAQVDSIAIRSRSHPKTKR
jgi:hypothetical protein